MTGVDDGERLALVRIGTGRIWDICGGFAVLKGRGGDGILFNILLS